MGSVCVAALCCLGLFRARDGGGKRTRSSWSVVIASQENRSCPFLPILGGTGRPCSCLTMFLGASGLCCCAWTFFGCSKQLFVVMRACVPLSSLQWILLFRGVGSRRTGLVAPWQVGSSPTRDRTRVPCIGGQVLNQRAAGEVPTPVS